MVSFDTEGGHMIARDRRPGEVAGCTFLPDRMQPVRICTFTLTSFGNLWQLMAAYDILWQLMAAYDNIYGNLWQIMGILIGKKLG